MSIWSKKGEWRLCEENKGVWHWEIQCMQILLSNKREVLGTETNDATADLQASDEFERRSLNERVFKYAVQA